MALQQGEKAVSQPFLPVSRPHSIHTPVTYLPGPALPLRSRRMDSLRANAKAVLKATVAEAKQLARDNGVLEKTCNLRFVSRFRIYLPQVLRLVCSELIKATRKCKTAAEERALIAKESAAMRAEFREQASVEASLRPRLADGNPLLGRTEASARAPWRSSCSCTCSATPRTSARWSA